MDAFQKQEQLSEGAIEIMKGILRDKDLVHYEKCYEAMLRHQKSKSTMNIEFDRFRSLVIDCLPDTVNLKYLSFGSGTGENDLKVIRWLFTKYPSIEATFVDPSSLYNSKFKVLLADNKNDLEGLKYTFVEEPVEDFLQKIKPLKSKFHFISSVLALFYVQTPRETLLGLYGCLYDGGLLATGLPSSNVVIVQLRLHFFRHILSPITGPRPIGTPKQVEQIFQQAGIPYKSAALENPVDITDCFVESSVDGSLILDLFTQVVNFRANVTKQDLQIVLDAVRKL